MIFQDIGINEETLVKTEIRGFLMGDLNRNNVFTSHNINPTSVNYSEQTIPSNMKSYESFRKIQTSNV